MNSNNSDKIRYLFDMSDIICIPKDDYEKFEFVTPNVCECAVGVIVGETGAIMTHTFKQDSAEKIGEFIKKHLPDQDLKFYTYGGNINDTIVPRKQDLSLDEHQDYKKKYYSRYQRWIGYTIPSKYRDFLKELLNKESQEGFFTLSAEEKSAINVKIKEKQIDLSSNDDDLVPSHFSKDFVFKHENFMGERNISVIERGAKKGCNKAVERGNEHQYTPAGSNLQLSLTEDGNLDIKIAPKLCYWSTTSESKLIQKANVSGYTKH